MKSLRTLAARSLLLLLAAANLYAQPHDAPRPSMLPDSCRIVEMVSRLAESLDLSEAQKIKTLQLYVDYFSKVKQEMKSQKAENEKHGEIMQNLRLDFEEEVKALLSEEQVKKYEQQLKERPGRPGRRYRPESAGQQERPMHPPQRKK